MLNNGSILTGKKYEKIKINAKNHFDWKKST
jgi:hypothetical protein